MSSEGLKLQEELQEQINGLIIEGSKYTANGDLEKAVKCYAQVLDLESQRPEYYVLLAKCLYQLGLQKNDVFGGGQEEFDAESDDDDVEDADDGIGAGGRELHGARGVEMDSESDSESETPRVSLNQRFFQFDHEEEEISNDPSGQDAVADTRSVGAEGAEQEQEDAGAAQEALALSSQESFKGYLEGDVFENAMELLFRARIMYIETPSSSPSLALNPKPSSSPSQSASSQPSPSRTLKKDVQLRLVEIYDLLGDIDQELEDFSQSIQDYEESIRYYREATSLENDEKIINTYLKMVESLRWLDADDAHITQNQHKKYLEKIIGLIQKRVDEGESKDLQEDNQRLERLKEDVEALEKGKINLKEKFLAQSSMMEALLQQALSKSPRNSVNDLSHMVKKKKVRK